MKPAGPAGPVQKPSHMLRKHAEKFLNKIRKAQEVLVEEDRCAMSL